MRLTLNKYLIIFVLSVMSYPLYAAETQTSAKHLGLKTVVIDPGHGGKDPGALGKTKNQHEKHIVLAVAKRLGDKIKAEYPDVKVIYTRTGDTFLGLHDRAMVARNNNADLFISIHCNGSSSADAKGSSVHILGQNSNNKKNKTDYFERNMSVAQRENSVIVLEEDYRTKYQTFDPASPESYISHQLQWMAYYESSLLFASEVVDKLIQEPLTPRRIVIDQDIFQVLVEANMPAVLLELAFVTNPAEYRFLSSASGQDEIAGRLFKAFCSYKTKFDQSVSVERVPAPVPLQTKPASETMTVEDQYYSIQIMALGRLLKENDPVLKGIKASPVRKENDKVYKYIYGKYTTLEDARKGVVALKKKFPDAFPVLVKDNVVERIK